MAIRMTVLDVYNLDERGAIIPTFVDTTTPGDWGCDPLADGMFKMIPSGDVVTYAEREKRLALRRR